MNHSLLFLDVEDTEQPLVLAAFPNAAFGPGTLTGNALVELCKDADVISVHVTTHFTRDVIQKLPKLKLLCTRTVGYDHIDIAACTEQNIVVTHVPDYGSHVIAEHVFALLLSTLRNIPAGTDRVKSFSFDHKGLRGIALKDKTIGIIGTGKIGRHACRMAYGFDMRILAHDIIQNQEIVDRFGVKYVDLPELLHEADIITLHVPALPETNHMMNEQAFASMKDGVILVNTSRGAVIDSQALLKALQSGKVGKALLDVLENEEDLKKNQALIEHPHVTVTPHIAYFADESVRNMFTDCFESIQQWMKGETPTHKVKS